ncbi:MAG: ATP-binding protein [Bacteroidales bacterium]|nr:ATP-binding protein [Bacteroidales bacterium]
MPEESLKALNLNTLWNNTMIGGYLKTNIECQPLREVHKWMKGYLHHLILPKENLTQYISNKIYQGCIDKDVMVPLLQQADFNVSDIEVSRLGEGQYDVRLSHQGKALPFKLESLGTQRYYGLAGLLYLMIKEPSAFMIDELDESLHPDLYQHLLLAFCVNAHGSQLIASTHNRELLSNSDVYRNDMIHFTNRSEDSTTQLYRLSDFDRDLDFATEDILSIYNAGRFGAVPILGDYWTSKYLSKTSAISE